MDWLDWVQRLKRLTDRLKLWDNLVLAAKRWQTWGYAAVHSLLVA